MSSLWECAKKKLDNVKTKYDNYWKGLYEDFEDINYNEVLKKNKPTIEIGNNKVKTIKFNQSQYETLDNHYSNMKKDSKWLKEIKIDFLCPEDLSDMDEELL